MYFNGVICLLAAAAAELKCAITTQIKIQNTHTDTQIKEHSRSFTGPLCRELGRAAGGADSGRVFRTESADA